MKKIFTFLALFSALYAHSQPPNPISTSLVISEVYGGAGCGTAGCSTYQNDFIEIYNNSASPVDINGYSVQYTSATGTAWQVTTLASVPTYLQPGQYFLVGESFGANGVNPLPAPDKTGTIAMSATAAKVALVSNNTALSGACPNSAAIIDFVGYGATANCSEGTGPALGASTTLSATRSSAGVVYTETGNNNTDFSSAAPTPQNSGGLILALSLEEFTAQKKGNGSLLQWLISCPNEAVELLLQRSADGVDFHNIYSTTSLSNCGSPITYTDKAPLQGKNYYRLAMKAADGSFTFSALALLSFSDSEAGSISIRPSFVKNEANIYFSPLKAGKVQLVVSDVQGRVVKTITSTLLIGENKIAIPVNGLSAGQYRVSGVSNGEKTVSAAFIKL